MLGERGEEKCTAAEEAPFGLDGLGNVAGENRRVRCCTARSLVARPSSRRARGRAMAWGRRRRKPRAARRAMKRATIDETTELSSARRGGANERGAAAERRVIFRLGGPLSRRGLGPAGRGGHSGGTQRTFARSGFGFGLTPQQTKQLRVASRRLINEACVNRGARPPRVAVCIWIGFSWAPIIRFWAPAGILK